MSKPKKQAASDEDPLSEEPEEDEPEDSEEEEVDNESDGSDEDYGETKNMKRKNPKGKKSQPGRKKQKTIKRFFQELAEESEGDDESEIDDDSIDPNERKEAAEALKTNLNIYDSSKRKVPDLLNLPEDALEERYAIDDDDENIEDDEDMMPGERDEKMGQIYQQKHLPGDEDPKVFAVKCREKMERDSVLKLMTKYMFMKFHENVDLKIFSASSIEKFPGYIYVESTSEVNVRNAIKEIQGLRFGENTKIKIIPKNEVPSIYSLDETKQIDKNIQKGQFVRIKKGLYTGDLAKIVDVNVDLFEAVVKIVPRLEKIEDASQKRGFIEEDEEEKKMNQEKKEKIKYSKKNLNTRPPKQLFNSNNYPQVYQHRKHQLTKNDTEIDLSSSNSHHNFEYNGQIFLNGLLYLKVKIDNLQVKDVIPTLEETEFFVQVEPNLTERSRMYDKAIEMIEETKRNINKFQKGDHVRVVDGDLTNLRGIVISSADKEVKIMTITPPSEAISLDLQQLTFQTNQLLKYFKEGDHVKVQNGKTGTVLKVEDHMATILLDNHKEDVKCFVNDLMKSSEYQTEQVKNIANADYKKFDLVKLISQDSAGLVLKVDKDSMVIIDERGKVTSVNFFSIESKVVNKNASYQNNFKQNITLDSSVKVMDGLHKGRIATVKSIFKDVLFLFDQEIRQNSGIFVEKGNNCYLINTNINNKNRVPHYNMNRDSNDPNQRPRGKDSLIGQQCIVKKGGWKGFEGIIKDADDKTVRIELSAKARVITIPRELVGLKNEPAESNDYETTSRFDQIGKTPIHPGMRGSAFNPTSPFHGQSPGYIPSSPFIQ